VRPLLSRLIVLCVLLVLAGCGGATSATGSVTGSAIAGSVTAQTASASASSAATTSAATSSSPSTTAAAVTTSSTALSTASSLSATAASSPTTTASASASAATQYPLTVTDDQGTSVTLAAKPTHIVSLVPSNTEILYAVGAGDDLMAGTQYDDYPPEAKSKALIKGLKPSLEVVTAYHPDLVLASTSNASDLIQQLRTLHIPVVYLDPHDFSGVYHDIQLVGQIVDAAPAAQKVVAGMQQKVGMVTAKTASVTARPRVFVEIDASDPTKIFTVGPGSFIDALVTMAGGANIAHDAKSAYPQLGLEALVAADPQVIVLDDAAFGATPDAVAKRPGWSSLAAVKDHRVFPIDDSLVSRPGPRLADGLLAMAKLIHPELFP
jgi:iron complex transport system substrate-binding protein